MVIPHGYSPLKYVEIISWMVTFGIDLLTFSLAPRASLGSEINGPASFASRKVKLCETGWAG
jgi:hypothetical protein